MSWTVKVSRSAEKQKAKLSKPLQQILYALIHDIEKAGPVRGDWPNYGKLTGGKHHNVVILRMWQYGLIPTSK